MRARYYDLSAGRFASEDPIGFSGGANFYIYAANNPEIFSDPFGLAPSCVMTHSGLQCQNNNPVDNEIDVVKALFPGSVPSGASLIVHASCTDVAKVLENTRTYYVGGQSSWSAALLGSDQWMSGNPFLFWDPIAHRGGSEVRRLSGFHFRLKYPTNKDCNSCTLDQFHIDSNNPMLDPLGHVVNDLVPWVRSKLGL